MFCKIMNRVISVLFFAAAALALSCCSGERAVRSLKSVEEPVSAGTAEEAETGRQGPRTHTLYGFFPTPPDFSRDAVLDHFQALGKHGDFLLLQPNVPWKDFAGAADTESQAKKDLRIQVELGRRNGLDSIFVIDPLNGLDRREFLGLPEGWKASFGDPRVRSAFTNFTLWVLDEFQPAYLGLASEINTYMDAHPDDVSNYLSLYSDVYDLIKREQDSTKVFVTFQWDDLNNVIPEVSEGREPFDTNWEQVDAFGAKLDLWAISSYPYFVFNGDTQIPDNYYTPLAERAAKMEEPKPIAFAEGGYSSRSFGPLKAAPRDQAAFIKAVEKQLGADLVFWVNLLLNDIDMDMYGSLLREQGRTEKETETLSRFAFTGLRDREELPKPALRLWDEYRRSEE